MKLVIIGIVVVILIAAGLFFLNQSPKSPEPLTQTQQEDKLTIEDSQTIDSNLVIGSDSASPSPVEHGFYDFYSQDGFGYSKSEKKILFFFATWCPECKEADEDFKTNVDKLPEGIAVFKIHYNDPETSPEDKNLAKKYGIVYQHTFVQVDNESNEITKWNGGGLDKLLSSIK